MRRQLSLYLPDDAAAPIEAIRRLVDPVQHALIPPHVTLCRDEEAAALTSDAITRAVATSAPVVLAFGPAVEFDGHGILLPCVAGEDAFVELRKRLLGVREVRRQSPHITLAHPRNPKAASNSLDHALMLPSEIKVTFREINLIEQKQGSAWRIVERYALSG